MDSPSPTSSLKTLTLVTGVVVVLIVVAGVVIQRSRAAASEGLAFHVSEAGLEYVLHTLNNGACTPAELIAQEPLVQAMFGTEEDTAPGVFVVNFGEVAEAATESLNITVQGRTGGFMPSCHTLAAKLEAFSGTLGTKYRVASWENHGVTRCGLSLPPTPLTCGLVKD